MTGITVRREKEMDSVAGGYLSKGQRKYVCKVDLQHVDTVTYRILHSRHSCANSSFQVSGCLSFFYSTSVPCFCCCFVLRFPSCILYFFDILFNVTFSHFLSGFFISLHSTESGQTVPRMTTAKQNFNFHTFYIVLIMF